MGNRFQQNIPILVSQPVIDMLKIIQSHIKQRSCCIFFPGLSYKLSQILFAAHAIKQPCQEIIVRLIFNFFLINFLFGNIIECTHGNFSAIHPVNLGLMHIQPAFLNHRINFLIILAALCLPVGKKHLFQMISCDTAREKFFEFVIHIKNRIGMIIDHIYSTSGIFQNRL